MRLQVSTFSCYDFYRKRVRNEPQPLRFVFTRCGSLAAFRALPQKKNCISCYCTPDFLDSNLRKHGKLITKTQKKSMTSSNWEARSNGHRQWNWITNRPTKGKKYEKKTEHVESFDHWVPSSNSIPPSSDKLISRHVIELASKGKQPTWTREVRPPYGTLLLEPLSEFCEWFVFIFGCRNWHNSAFNF